VVRLIVHITVALLLEMVLVTTLSILQHLYQVNIIQLLVVANQHLHKLIQVMVEV